MLLEGLNMPNFIYEKTPLEKVAEENPSYIGRKEETFP